MLILTAPLMWVSLSGADAAPSSPEPTLVSTSPRMSTEALLAEMIAPPEPWQGRGTRRAWEPDILISAGVQWIDGDYDLNPQAPSAPDDEQNPGISLDVVFFNWTQERGVALEFGFIYNTYEFDVTGIDTEEVDVYRLMAGLRLADRGPTDTFWIPYLRAGGMYRIDSGDTVDEDGLGWYLGGGIDFRFGTHFAITPQLLYSDNTSVNSQEWLLGLLVGFGF